MSTDTHAKLRRRAEALALEQIFSELLVKLLCPKRRLLSQIHPSTWRERSFAWLCLKHLPSLFVPFQLCGEKTKVLEHSRHKSYKSFEELCRTLDLPISSRDRGERCKDICRTRFASETKIECFSLWCSESCASQTRQVHSFPACQALVVAIGFHAGLLGRRHVSACEAQAI